MSSSWRKKHYSETNIFYVQSMRKWKKRGGDLLFKNKAEFSAEMYTGDFVRHRKKIPITLKPVQLKSQVMRIQVFPSIFF